MDDKIFLPFYEELFSEERFGELMQSASGSPLGELVPYQVEYRCVRLLDGTFEFDFDVPKTAAKAGSPTEQSLPAHREIVHAA